MNESRLRALVARAWPIIQADHPTIPSVSATRVLLDVFKQLGVRASPLVAGLRAFNAGYHQLARQLGHAPSTAELFAGRASTGAYALGVGVGVSSAAHRWPGHLVALVEADEGPYLVDVTAGQISRPRHGITTGPLVVPYQPGQALLHALDAGASVLYTPQPRDTSYRASMLWRLDHPTLVSEIMASERAA